jgi:hypothetical protein
LQRYCDAVSRQRQHKAGETVRSNVKVRASPTADVVPAVLG